MMRYDVYEGSGGLLLLNVQSDLLDQLKICIVVPLIHCNQAPTPAQRLNPIFDINGEDYVMVTQFMASVESYELKQFVTNLSSEHDRIIAALDMLFQGF